MRSPHVYERALAASLLASVLALAVLPTASAVPDDPGQADTPAPAPAAVAAPVSEDVNPAAVEACAQFAAALDHAAVNYSDFANEIAGEGWSYADPTVASANVTGRTALREAAAAALSASATPGLQPEVASPMRKWSLDAAKLLVFMGVHGNVDSINAKASELNEDTTNAQMACANAGTHA